MKKLYLTLIAFIFVFCAAGCTANANENIKTQTASVKVVQSTQQAQATAQPQVTPNPTPEPTPEPTPIPYTEEWIEKYAPASVMDYEMQVGNGTVDEVTSYPPADTYRLVVDYNNQCVRAYSQDADKKYTVLERVMICTTGGNGNWTPEGIYTMGENRYRFGEFKKLGGFAQYWSQMYNSFYFHSILYNERSATSLVKSSYNNLGTPCSHGCIRLLVPDAQWIYENCAPGTQCEVTTEIPKDENLKDVLKYGYECAVDTTLSAQEE